MHRIIGTNQLLAVEAAFTSHFFAILFQNTGTRKISAIEFLRYSSLSSPFMIEIKAMVD